MGKAPNKDWIEAILRGCNSERWYKDGDPKWIQGKNSDPAKTSAQAGKERATLVKFFKRHGSHIKEARALRLEIKRCEPRRRCTSSACPECARAFQRWFTQVTIDFLQKQKLTRMVTLVPGNIQIHENKLSSELFGPTRSVIARKLAETGIDTAVGGCDISLNRHEKNEFPPHWQPHAVVFAGEKIDQVSSDDLIGKQDKCIALVWRQMRVDRYNGNVSGIAYSMKENFFYRETLVRFTKEDGDSERQNTRSRYLPAPQKLSLLLALDEAGLMARVILVGVKLIKGKRWPKLKRILTGIPRP